MCVVAEGSHEEFQLFSWLSCFSQHLVSGCIAAKLSVRGLTRFNILCVFNKSATSLFPSSCRLLDQSPCWQGLAKITYARPGYASSEVV